MADDLCNEEDTNMKIHSIWQLVEIDAQEQKKIHRGENINKCNQCDHETNSMSGLKTHLSYTNATSATFHPLGQAIWGDI